MQKLSEKLRKKLPRIMLNLAVMFSIWFIATLISPAVQSMGAAIPGSHMSAGFMIIISMIIVIGYFAISVSKDLVSLAEGISELLLTSTGLAREGEGANFRKAIKKVVIAVFLIVLTPIIPGTIALIPVAGPTLATIIFFAFLIFSLSLFWDSGKVFYKHLSRYTEKIADVVAGEAEKIEEKAKLKPKRKKRK